MVRSAGDGALACAVEGAAGGCDRGAVACARDVERGTATGSAVRVTVPFRLKFCRSRGPIASVAGVFVGLAAVVASWASAGSGPSDSPTAKTATPKRQTAFINSRFLLVNRAIRARKPMPFNRRLFKQRLAE